MSQSQKFWAPPSVSFRRDLIGSRLESWNWLLDNLEGVKLVPAHDDSAGIYTKMENSVSTQPVFILALLFTSKEIKRRSPTHTLAFHSCDQSETCKNFDKLPRFTFSSYHQPEST
jgi:hypothetical protein